MAKPGKKKFIIAGVVAVIVLVVVILVVKLRGAGTTEGEVDYGDAGGMEFTASNYYNGIIEPQETWEIKKDADRSIAEVYVEEGDQVTAGEKLFAYKTDDVSMQIQQAKLELESIGNEISDVQSQIDELNRQKAGAAEDQQLEYTLQIQELQTSQKQSALNKKTKQVEIDTLQKSMDNAVVTSKMDGVVKNISTSSDSEVYMTILATGAYQVKGSIDELNVGSISEGMSVGIHSRVDDTKTWDGTITKIDTENAQQDQNQSMYYDGGSSDQQASKYYFYVSLTTGEDLLLGQHVYVEPVYDAGTENGGVDDSNVTTNVKPGVR